MTGLASLSALWDSVPRWTLEVGFFAYAVVITALVLLERRRPTATLALVLALIFLPVVGLVVYLVFSRRRIRRRKLRQRRPISAVEGTQAIANLDIETMPQGLTPVQRGLVRLALKTAAIPLRYGEHATLLHTATLAHDAFVRRIQQATRCIHVESYIWRDDTMGRHITALLTERAQQGVKVRVLYDHLGSLTLPNDHFAALREAGGEVAAFGRLRIPMRLRPKVNFRNHRKIMTIDGHVGMMGGLNIGNEYLDPNGDAQRWRDLHVELIGDVVVGLEAIFLDDWMATTGQVIDLQGELPERANSFDGRQPLPRARPWRRPARLAAAQARARDVDPFSPRPDLPMTSTGPLIQVIPSGPDLPMGAMISAQLSATIATTQQRAWIVTPYFVPDEPMMLILRTAALRGVDVRLLVPKSEHNDQWLVAWASRSYYDEFLDSGGRIFAYQDGMLHAKYLIMDEICAIGSANMDIRSFHINFEVTAMFYDAGVTAKVAALFEGDCKHAEEVTKRQRRGLGLGVRLAEGAARLMSPLL